MRAQIDTLDRRIIRTLQRDVRASYKSIGDELGCSHNTVRMRMDRMLSEGILRLMAVTSPQKVGFETTAYIGVRVEPHALEAVGAALTARREVSNIVHTIGNQDIMMLAHFADNQQLFRFVNHVVARMPGVISTDTSIICEVLRGLPNSYEPRLDGPAGKDNGEAVEITTERSA
ncbi:MAG: Lrp/AsnC family transcriptional regulator [Dehalococcoidia bacterium]